MARGVLHLVVGPSGAGKDTLMDAARAARPDLLFPRRWVTRSAEAGGEDIHSVDAAAFEAGVRAGRFVLWWDAHGLRYGIPAEAGDALDSGRSVVANVSRAVIADARARLSPLRILNVTATVEVLATRLAARGRESATDIAERLARAGYQVPSGPDVFEIDNGGSVADGTARFLRALAPAETG